MKKVMWVLIWGTSKSYAECMQSLGTLGVLDKEISENFVYLIKMRNIIVHQYRNINHKILFESLRVLENDFLKFKSQILGWLGDHSETNSES